MNVDQRPMLATRGPEHRSIVVLDIAGSSRWHNQAQLHARRVLMAAVRTASRAAAMTDPAVEDRGDGMILLIPASVSKVDILDPFIPRLAEELHQHNHMVDPLLHIRIRVAVHAGELHRDEHGWVGTDLNTACRLVNADQLYAQLRHSPARPLALVVSDLIYQGVVRHHYRTINPHSYLPIRVIAKELDTRAWIHNAAWPSPNPPLLTIDPAPATFYRDLT
jgi:hypothetical protein